MIERRFYRFAWSSFLGMPLQIPRDAKVEAIVFGKRRAVLVRYNGELYITDRYALRKHGYGVCECYPYCKGPKAPEGSTGSTGKKGVPDKQEESEHRFVEAWSWPAGVEDFIEKHIEPCDRPNGHIHCLHVCSGASRIGDVKVDLFNPSDIKADMFHLPVRPGSVCVEVCDPPWHIPYHVRHKLLYELRDALKPNGLLIFNAIFSPKVRGMDVQPKFYAGMPNATWRNASLLFLARRSALTVESMQEVL